MTPQILLHRLRGFSTAIQGGLTLPGPQTNILRIILDTSLSITLHMKPLITPVGSTLKICQESKQLLTTSMATMLVGDAILSQTRLPQPSLLTDVPESIPLLQSILTGHQMTPVKCKPTSFPAPGTANSFTS